MSKFIEFDEPINFCWLNISPEIVQNICELTPKQAMLYVKWYITCSVKNCVPDSGCQIVDMLLRTSIAANKHRKANVKAKNAKCENEEENAIYITNKNKNKNKNKIKEENEENSDNNGNDLKQSYELYPFKNGMMVEEKRDYFWLNDVKRFVPQFGIEMCQKFFLYWSKADVVTKKLRMEDDRHWDTLARLKSWKERELNNEMIKHERLN